MSEQDKTESWLDKIIATTTGTKLILVLPPTMRIHLIRRLNEKPKKRCN
jgi:hypothetical protein